MFQNDFGPPKHVLHLVWSVLGISTAIKTALKVALYDFFDGPLAPLNGQFMEKVNHYYRTKHKDFFNGTKCKICFGHHRFNFPQKMGVNFFPARLDTKGGGGGPGASCLMPQNLRVLIFEYFPNAKLTESTSDFKANVGRYWFMIGPF